MASEAKSAAETTRQRLSRYNPFVSGLENRRGVRHDNFLLFDGQSTLETYPMQGFDGYPLKREYLYFVPIVLLAVYAVLLPIAPLVWDTGIVTYGAAIFGGFVLALAYCILTAFHLTGIRTAYQTANSDIQNLNFVTKAHGIRSIIHNFKTIVRWRRFMRYTMNLGYFTLILLFLSAVIGVFRLVSGFSIYASMVHILFSAALFVTSALSLLVFEYGRKTYTEGMDPTLALVLMIEEIGGQLANRPTIVTNTRRD